MVPRMTNLSYTPQQQRSLQFPEADMIYRFALDCAAHKINVSCDNCCNQCASNISHYVDDARTAVMVQHAAELEVQHKHKLRHQERMYELEYAQAQQTNGNSLAICMIVFMAMVLMFVATIVFLWKKPANISHVPFSTEQAPSFVDDVPGIEAALRQVRAIDVDGDGKANCVDHTIQFYNAYPNKSQVRIIWNRNDKMGWNHLFVSVNGTPIEAGAYVINNPQKKIRIADMWPTYNDAYNRDLTSVMEYIIAGTYWIR